MSESKLSKFPLGFERLEEEGTLMRGVAQRLRRRTEAKLKRKKQRKENAKRKATSKK